MNIDRQIMELRIQLSHPVSEEKVLKYTARLQKLQQIKTVSSVQDPYEPLCDHCEYRLADVFEVDGDYCLECWKKHTHPDVQSPTRTTTAATISSSSCLYKAVLSLDSKPIGYVTGEEYDNMMIITDYKTGNVFIIPTCKVISIDKLKADSLILDIEHREAIKYRIVEEKSRSQNCNGVQA
ncbi:MAG TPA: hypothetical protein VJ225_03565 [Nitrososphaeraceae archaeon]|nr:hypothetical protein [Nitrososphaeraceae archaeon]